jgi:hypothetical protein
MAATYPVVGGILLRGDVGVGASRLHASTAAPWLAALLIHAAGVAVA